MSTSSDERGHKVKRNYTVKLDSSRNTWVLQHAVSGKVLRVFETKEDATRAGVLRKAIGTQGGTVRILRSNGTFEEERVFAGGG